MTKYPIIHLWSPYAFHEESYIVTNREGLLELKKAIDIACEEGKTKTEVFMSDGEGYDLHILITKDEVNMAMPYTADYSKERRKNAVYPWDLIK